MNRVDESTEGQASTSATPRGRQVRECCASSRTIFEAARAFTLLEILVVVSIILLLTGVLLSGIHISRSRDMSNGGTMIMETLALAREMAISGNHPMEVWFVRPASTGDTFFCAMQVFSVDTDGNSTPYAEVLRLPVSVGIDSGSALFTLLTSFTTPAVPISSYGTNCQVGILRFLADGSFPATQLGVGNPPWFLTLHERIRGDQLTAQQLLKGIDYAVISVNAKTGKANLYRP